MPRLVRFGGVVKDLNGTPRTGVVSITFALYRDQEGGAALWLETQNANADDSGRYTVLLGANSSEGLPLDLFSGNEARWLGIRPDGQDELPRVLLVSVPYALKAADAETLGGRPPSAYVLTETITAVERAGTSLGSSTLVTGIVQPLAVNTTATSFVDTTIDQVVLVQQNGTGKGLHATASTGPALSGVVSGTGSGVWGDATAGTGGTYGVYGRSASTGGRGVLGEATATTGSTYGVYGTTKSSSGRGVFGWATSASGNAHGVYGQSASQGAGVYGVNTVTTGPSYGIFGVSYSSAGRGLVGTAESTTGATYGIIARSKSDTGVGGWADAPSATGSAIGLLATVSSSGAIAAVLKNSAGGKLLSGQVGTEEKFSVSGSGNIVAAGSLTAAGGGTYGGDLTVTAPGKFVGDGSALTGIVSSHAASADTATTADHATSADSATFATAAGTAAAAAVADNSTALGGQAASSYARRDVGNSLIGDQAVTGNISATGAMSAGTTITAANFVGNGAGLTNVTASPDAALLARVAALETLVSQLASWQLSFGDTTYDAPWALALDPGGNVFICGTFQGSVNFGGGILTSAGGQDIFLVKYDRSGSHLWSKRFGSTSHDGCRALTVDTDAIVYATGYFQGTVNFGGSNLTSAGGDDIFLVKIASDGAHLWSKRFGSTANDKGNDLEVNSGNVYVTGYFEGMVDFGGGLLTSAGSIDIFLAKFEASAGTHLWSKDFGSIAVDNGYALAVDAAENVYVTGTFEETVNFGGKGDALTSAGERDIFLAKFSALGTHLWSKRFGGLTIDAPEAVAADASGVYVTGMFEGTVNFGDRDFVAEYRDIFIAKYTANGAHLWSKQLGSTSDDGGWALALDASGSLYVAGAFCASVDFGGGALASAGSRDVFVAKYTAAGAHLWSRRFGGTSSDRGLAVGVDPSNLFVYVAGDFSGTVDFGFGPVTSAGYTDIFLLRLLN